MVVLVNVVLFTSFLITALLFLNDPHAFEALKPKQPTNQGERPCEDLFYVHP